MQKFDVIVIGSGLGGLQCAYILAKHGMNVCVLEKNSQPGGCLQTFQRHGTTFDTGFHYVGGLGEGQPLNRLFKYFDLLHLPWKQLDENGFDEVVINDKSYLFANGYERFVETLSQQFPQQHANLKRYADFLNNVSNNIFGIFEEKNKNNIFETSLFTKSAHEFLTSMIDDPLLINVLSGTSLKMELRPESLPLYIFAQINGSFLQSAWRLKGGGSQIADSLIKSFQKTGGTVLLKSAVTRLIEDGGKIAAAEINGEEQLTANLFISDIHPTQTIALIDDSRIIRKTYRKRIANLENTYGMFTANIALKAETVPYLNRNIYVYKKDNVWDYAEYKPENVNSCAMISFGVPHNNSHYAENIDILTPMYRQETERWSDSRTGHRNDEYNAMKQHKAETCIRLISEHIPILRDIKLNDAVENIYTGTPLTYRDYTTTPQGSAYGIRKDYRQLMTTLLSPRTPEPNLFLTGQNLNLHGILGVSITSFLTCAEILGMKTAMKEIF